MNYELIVVCGFNFDASLKQVFGSKILLTLFNEYRLTKLIKYRDTKFIDLGYIASRCRTNRSGIHVQ